MRAQWGLLPIALVAGCGARTELGSSEGPPLPCTKSPWVVFDYDSPQSQRFGIAAMRADGSSFHQLDLSGVVGVFPSVAPDSKSMVYLVVNSDAAQTVEALNVFDFASRTNRTLVQLTVDSDNEPGLGMAAISPDNQLVAYSTRGFDLGVRVVGFDGSNDRVLGLSPWNGWVYGRPVFSPGSSTVYASTFLGRLESIHTDGTGRTLLEDPVNSSWAGPADFPANPSFSPDHTRLVAQISCKAAELRVFSLDDLPGDPCTAGTKLVEVEKTPSWNQAANAAWGPSNLIAYESGKDIMLIDPASGAPSNLTASITKGPNDVASDPTWASGCAELP